MRRPALSALLALPLLINASAGCNGGGGGGSPTGGEPGEVKELEAEVADLRAEVRSLRDEVRALREERRAAPPVTGADGDADADGDAGPATGEPAVAPAEPPPAKTVNITIDSNPAGATVFLADKKLGVTPLVLSRQAGSEEIRLRVEKDGYRPRLMTLRPEEDTKLGIQLERRSR